MDKFDIWLAENLAIKHPLDAELALKVYKRVLFLEKRNRWLGILFLALGSYPLMYYFIFGIPFNLLVRLSNWVGYGLSLINTGITTHLSALFSMLLIFIAVLVLLILRIWKPKVRVFRIN